MKFGYGTLMVFSCLFLQFFALPLWSQPVQYSTDNLIKMPVRQFEPWLASQVESVEGLDIDSITWIICSRFKNEQGISGKALVQFVQDNKMSYQDKVRMIDNILPCVVEDKLISLDLLHTKSVYLENDFTKDSVLLVSTYLTLDSLLKETNKTFLRIQYLDYLKTANIYLNKYQDKERAIGYFIKVRQYPFYLLDGEDLLFFKNLYIQASIGHIKCLKGNYSMLKTLNFIPSAFPEILPALQSAFEEVGEKCDLCENYLENPQNFIKYGPRIKE